MSKDEELTLKLIETVAELHSRLETDSVELDADAKRALYGNLRRLLRRAPPQPDKQP